jgi:hypothetical protein
VERFEDLKRALEKGNDGYSPVPFWFWNDRIERKEITRQLEMMREKGITSVIIHPRAGLLIPYLSDQWWELFRFGVKEAKRLGMKVWIYDELHFPSGFAGGMITERNPRAQAKHLAMLHKRIRGGRKISIRVPEGEVVAAIAIPHPSIRKDIDTAKEITGLISDNVLKWEVPEGEIDIFVFLQRFTNYPTIKGYYVDLLDPSVTELFIELVHNQYEKHVGDEFGDTIIGFFTDEPGFYNSYRHSCTIPWTDGFREYFERKKGYDIALYLPGIWTRWGGVSTRVRQDYYDVLTQRYVESFFQPLSNWCEKRGLLLTGHLNEEENFESFVGKEGHFFRPMRYFHVPGVDNIANRNEQHVSKLASSASHIFGRRFALEETFGAFGFGLTIEQMKWVTDMELALGINLINLHAYFYSDREERAYDAPPPISHQNVWWEYIDEYISHTKRLASALSCGSRPCELAVYYPIWSVWEMADPIGIGGDSVKKMTASFKRVTQILLENHVEFDYIDDDAIISSTIDGGRMRPIEDGPSYSTVLLPFVSSIPLQTMRKLRDFVRDGGRLIALGQIPSSSVGINGMEEDGEIRKIAEEIWTERGVGLKKGRSESLYGKGVAIFLPEGSSLLPDILERYLDRNMKVMGDPEARASLRSMERRLGDSIAFFLSNLSPDPVRFSLSLKDVYGKRPELIREGGGMEAAMQYSVEDGRISLPISLEGYESIFVIVREDGPDLLPYVSQSRGIDAISSIEVGEGKEQFVRAEVSKGGTNAYIRIATKDGDYEGELKIPKMPSPILLSLDWRIRIGEEWKEIGRLREWREIGLSNYSGKVRYELDFFIGRQYEGYILDLDLGTVRDIAEVWINGERVGKRLWRPYLFKDISGLLRFGERNSLIVDVTNTLANRYGQYQQSGLIGPVRIVPRKEVDIPLKAVGI